MTRVLISRRIVKPSNCAIGFGIPTTKTGFEQSLRNEGSDYVRKWRGGWPQYSRGLLPDIYRLETLLKELRAHVMNELTLSDFGRLCSGAFDVVILFSHWKGDAVEFREGLVESQVIVETVPREFDGLLDLCVCHPKALVDALVDQRPRCLVRFEDIESKPHYWLYFYEVLFQRLASTETTYVSAFDEVICAHRKVQRWR